MGNCHFKQDFENDNIAGKFIDSSPWMFKTLPSSTMKIWYSQQDDCDQLTSIMKALYKDDELHRE